MSEKDYAPLSTYCVRALNDKLYEKRKTAALEIEKMVKDFLRVGETGEIRKLLRVLGQDFTLSQNVNSRKGGLIGLAAMSVALGKDTSLYVDDLVQPVLSCFNDQDTRVRYYACETLYNVIKVARGSVLPFFPEIFDSLSRLSADPDQPVKNASELVDRLLKDIVAESSSFDLPAFIPLLRERIYSKNAFTRQFIISWVSTLDSIADINMVVFLPEILDGLFAILSDPLAEIRKMCESVLGEFLHSIIENPKRVNFNAMVNNLTIHANSSEELVQFTALTWLKEFIRLAGCALLPYSSGILTAVLPNLAQDTESRKKDIIETAKIVNNELMKLIVQQKQQLTVEITEDSSEKVEAPLMDQLDNQLDLKSLVMIPDKLFLYVEDIFPMLLQALSDSSDEVVLLDLEVLAEISKSPAGLKHHSSLEKIPGSSLVKDIKLKPPANMNSYFTSFMVSLLYMFNTNAQLFEVKCPFIIRQLCILLNAENIFRTLSEILVIYGDARFSCQMVHTLNSILLTSTELFELRNQLKDLKTENSWSLFSCLYRSWCHSPIATVSLCLLSQTYKHACDLLQIFGDIEITVDFLTEIDKLVQLIESPIFTYLRLQLLDPQQNPYLVKSLYGLLMLLPQSDAFHTLRQRLSCVPNLQIMPPQKAKPKEERKPPSFINFDELLKHFKEIQDRRQKEKKTMYWK
ncbi:protein VAC14 homolog [Caerostris extrusa]|uniref:Protein VAC14 homolog n=1 Tax=Caerostris extrusa TaxID=172846 RepID=A0AAV4QNL5_CAEEX|nr:protein VAC14 homolog [Caerostris extrusa]